jgi:hypothetical protein
VQFLFGSSQRRVLSTEGRDYTVDSSLFFFKIYFLLEVSEETEVNTGSRLDTRRVGEVRHSVEVTPQEDEAGTDAEEDQSSPETDVVKSLPHAHPVGHLLGKGQ